MSKDIIYLRSQSDRKDVFTKQIEKVGKMGKAKKMVNTDQRRANLEFKFMTQASEARRKDERATNQREARRNKRK